MHPKTPNRGGRDVVSGGAYIIDFGFLKYYTYLWFMKTLKRIREEIFPYYGAEVLIAGALVYALIYAYEVLAQKVYVLALLSGVL